MVRGHLVVFACVWLGCGATTQSEVTRLAPPDDTRLAPAPTPPLCTVAPSGTEVEIACCLRNFRAAGAALFVEQPGGRFAETSLSRRDGCRYTAQLPAAPRRSASHYVEIFARDGHLVERTPLRPFELAGQERAAEEERERREAMARRPGRPPISGARVAGEVLLGGLFAIPVAFGGGLLVAALDDSECGEFCISTPVLVGAYAGACVGASFGVWVGGSHGDQAGRFDATLLGGLLGGAAAVGGIVAVSDDVGPASLLFVFLPPFTAAVGFNLTRRYENGVMLEVPVPTVDSTGRVLMPIAAGRF